MNFSTASAVLKKSIMYDMACALGRDLCFRCGQRIESYKDLSVDHKKAWMGDPDPKSSFYSLDNIAFSHYLCNIKARETGYGMARVGGKAKSRNKLGFKGVAQSKNKKRFRAVLRHTGSTKPMYSEYFPSLEEAAAAYDEMAARELGEKAVTNSMMGLL